MVDYKEDIDSINSSAEHVNVATLTFVAAAAYIGVAVSSTTHSLLLFGTTISLPILDVKVPLLNFFVLAPLLLWVLHVHLLLQQHLLARKTEALIEHENVASVEPRLTPALPVSILVGGEYLWVVRELLWILLGVIDVILPVSLLLLAQAVFAPYHEPAVTALHQLLTIVDLLGTWYFFFRTPIERVKNAVSVRRILTWPGMFLLVTTVVAICVGASLQGPGSGYEIRALGFFHSLLASRSLELGGEGATPNRVTSASSPEGSGDTGAAGEGRVFDFKGRDLRGANLSNAKLVGADFRGANLDGAIFVNADLHLARFTPLGGTDEVFDAPDSERKREEIARLSRNGHYKRASLRSVQFSGANLDGARLIMADLTGSNLEGSHLDGSELSFADMQDADVRDASLFAADLYHSRANMARFNHADLRAANLSGSHMIGADFQRANLAAANLADGDFRNSHLVAADLRATDLTNSRFEGADLREAQLQSAIGLVVREMRLRFAYLDRSVCGGGLKQAILSDLRGIAISSVKPAEWKRMEAASKPLATEAASAARQRLKRAVEESQHERTRDCGLGSLGLDKNRGVLFDDLSGGLKDGRREEDFLEALARDRADEICRENLRSSYSLGKAIEKELWGGYTPRDFAMERQLVHEIEQRRLAVRAFINRGGPCPSLKGIAMAPTWLIPTESDRGSM